MSTAAGATLQCFARPQRVAEVDVELMIRQIDELYLKWPFYGSRRLRDEPQHQEYRVKWKRVQRLMQQMGLRTVHPKPRTSQQRRGHGHTIYPYRLRNLSITRPNQVWANDIGYMPMAKGFMYLTVILDWYSRRVRRGGGRIRLNYSPAFKAKENWRLSGVNPR